MTVSEGNTFVVEQRAGFGWCVVRNGEVYDHRSSEKEARMLAEQRNVMWANGAESKLWRLPHHDAIAQAISQLEDQGSAGACQHVLSRCLGWPQGGIAVPLLDLHEAGEIVETGTCDECGAVVYRSGR